MRFFLILISGVGFLSGCATSVMTEKECLAGDWYGAGLADGAKGLLETAFDERAASCNEFGAPADGRAYEEGRAAALARLCTEAGGYEYGRVGSDYLGVCRAGAEPGFLSGYLAGRRLYAVESERNAAEARYNDAVSSLNYHRDELRRARKRLKNPDATNEQIKKAREEREYHAGQLPEAERVADNRLYELGRADEALAAVSGAMDDWRRGDAFLTARTLLTEAHAFARSENAISHCTDEMPDYAPRCVVAYEVALRDSQSDAVCAVGPGEARFVRRGPRRKDGQSIGFVQFFDFFPTNPRGRTARRPEAGFSVFFDQSGVYEGLGCAVSPGAG